jgi:hypothetical protein
MQAPRFLLRVATGGLALLAILLGPDDGAAQTQASIRLRVLAHETGEPLQGVNVSLPRLGLGSITDVSGWAAIAGVEPGTHELVISRLGFRSERIRLYVRAGATVEGEVDLVTEAVVLKGVNVEAERRSTPLTLAGFYQRQRMGNGSFRTREHFEAVGQRSSRFTDALQGMRGIRIQASPNGRGYIVQTSRGNCASQIYLNGVRIPPEWERRGRGYVQVPADLDALLGPFDVEAVEWYAGPSQIPAEFNITGNRTMSPECGVLVIWSHLGR